MLERRLDKFIETLSFDKSTTRASRLVKSTTIGQYFDQQVEITSPIDEATGNFSPEDLNSAYSYLCENAQEIVIERAAELRTEINGDHATQKFEADVNVAISRWLKGLNGRYHVTIHWRKSEEGWKIHSTAWQEMP